jgi:hypothetical protein
MIMTADIGLMGAYNATYALVDSNDQIYQQTTPYPGPAAREEG